MQATKPQTAAVGLTDSPAGLAAWLIEKLRAWSDRRPDGTSLLDRDAMLTDVTIYWLTGTIGSSMRMYRANEAIPGTERSRTIGVPTGYTLFPADIEPPAPDAWLERTTTDLVYVSRPTRAGHFAPIRLAGRARGGTTGFAHRLTGSSGRPLARRSPDWWKSLGRPSR
jgi:hypothetical protein